MRLFARQTLIKAVKLLTVKRVSPRAAMLATIMWVVSAEAATGSWSRDVPGVLVAMSDRTSQSQAISPPAGIPLGGATLTRVQWRFETPPSHPVNAWLCHPERCVALSGMRGSTTALEGMLANAPLHFRFALSPGQRPVRVQGLQVIVNYR